MTLVFKDGFESGDTSAWTNENDLGGILSVIPNTSMECRYVMQLAVDGVAGSGYVRQLFSGIDRFRCRFYIDPNSVAMANFDTFLPLNIRGNGTGSAAITLRYIDGTGYRVWASIRNDAGTYHITALYTLSDAPHFIEVDMKISSGPGNDDGYATFYIDGDLKESFTDVDNDTRTFDEIWFGGTQLDADTIGAILFDACEINDADYIGPAPPCSKPLPLFRPNIS